MSKGGFFPMYKIGKKKRGTLSRGGERPYYVHEWNEEKGAEWNGHTGGERKISSREVIKLLGKEQRKILILLGKRKKQNNGRKEEIWHNEGRVYISTEKRKEKYLGKKEGVNVLKGAILNEKCIGKKKEWGKTFKTRGMRHT